MATTSKSPLPTLVANIYRMFTFVRSAYLHRCESTRKNHNSRGKIRIRVQTPSLQYYLPSHEWLRNRFTLHRVFVDEPFWIDNQVLGGACMDHSITDRQPGAWIVRKSSKREYPPTRTSPGMEEVSWAPFVQVIHV